MNPTLRVLVSCRPEDSPDGNPGEQNDSVFEFAAWLSRTADINIRAITTFIRPWPSSSISKLGGKYKKWFHNLDAKYESRTIKALKNAGVEKSHWMIMFPSLPMALLIPFCSPMLQRNSMLT